MCRNIKKLRYPDRRPTLEELENAALQFVRKVSGYRVPSRKNEEVFGQAVSDVADAIDRMFDGLALYETGSPRSKQVRRA